MTSLDGEYMLLGRKSEDTSNIFVQYGQGATRTVNITGGAEKIQEAEFVDGLRFRVQSAKPFTLNADIPFGVNDKAIPEHAVPLSISFSHCLQTLGVTSVARFLTPVLSSRFLCLGDKFHGVSRGWLVC